MDQGMRECGQSSAQSVGRAERTEGGCSGQRTQSEGMPPPPRPPSASTLPFVLLRDLCTQ